MGTPPGLGRRPFWFLYGAPGPLKLAIGKYQAKVSIAPQYRRLFGISAGAATATVVINVVGAKNCPSPWGISTSSQSGRDWLDFSATVWVTGNAPLDVEGFHVAGSSLVAVYQYFWQDGKVIGRALVGTMGFDSRPRHNHWHFELRCRPGRSEVSLDRQDAVPLSICSHARWKNFVLATQRLDAAEHLIRAKHGRY